MKSSIIHFLSFFLVIFIYTCDEVPEHNNQTVANVDAGQLLADIEFLSSDELQGRFPESEGNVMAQNFIIERFQTLNLSSFHDEYRHPFESVNSRTGQRFENALNLIGYTLGRSNPDRFIAITAHYDHLGVVDGEIYNGADDNASGTGALLAAARYFSENQPENSMLFIALDAEEQGLLGAYEFVNNPPVSLQQIILNVNMDMISINFENELYAVGTYHYPFLKPLIETAATGAPVNVLFGYDSADWPQDWTMSSDHGPFHEKGVPFIYFGVEDHEHYHQPTDTFENINPEFYINAVETIIGILKYLDLHLEDIAVSSDR
ncbi:MAG: M28 family peptidase [Balneolaceae bacterium]|nr:MAG: M28 family peptidase [Balneolaceae bacterium]